MIQRTLTLVKPDGVEQGVIGQVVRQFEEEGLKVVGLRMLRLDRRSARGFYHVHRERPFFDSLVDFMTSGPIVAMVLEGEDAIARARKVMGATDPAKAEAGTLRRQFASSIEKNVVHGSDGPDTAAFEIPYFFGALDIHGKFSMRASITSELAFQDCPIPLENKFPKVKGLRGPLGCLNQARYGIAWGAVGAAMGCYDWTLQYAQQRVQFGKPIASFQLVQQKLVWMITEITKAQLLCLRLGQLKDAGRVRPQQISMAKMNNVQMALDGARLARDILGAAGIVDEHPIIRHMMNLETVNTYEGTHDIHTLIVGRDITGLDAFGI